MRPALAYLFAHPTGVSMTEVGVMLHLGLSDEVAYFLSKITGG